jgi:ABC-2 type transport system permease protein
MRAAHVVNVVRKELRQLRRDPRIYPIVLLAPILQLFLYGYAATFDLHHLPIAVFDADRSPESRAIVRHLGASGDFAPAVAAGSFEDVERALVRGDARIGVAFLPGFGRQVREGRRPTVGLFVDGADSNTATIARSSLEAVIGRQAVEIVSHDLRARDAAAAARLDPLRSGEGLPEALDVRTRIFYNPELKSSHYMVPGVIVMILLVMTMMLSALSIVKEKEIGTFEMLLATPIRPAELVAGKLAPFVTIGFVDVLIVLATATWWFEVPVAGSAALLLAFAAAFILTTIALGLLVSTIAATQQQAMVIAFCTLLPMILLSGMIFPLESMPRPVRIASYTLPMRYILEAVRAIFLRGVGLDVLWRHMALLAAIGAGLLCAAILRFRKRMA